MKKLITSRRNFLKASLASTVVAPSIGLGKNTNSNIHLLVLVLEA